MDGEPSRHELGGHEMRDDVAQGHADRDPVELDRVEERRPVASLTVEPIADVVAEVAFVDHGHDAAEDPDAVELGDHFLSEDGTVDAAPILQHEPEDGPSLERSIESGIPGTRLQVVEDVDAVDGQDQRHRVTSRLRTPA